MESNLPSKDSHTFKTTQSQTDWEKVAVKDLSGQMCKLKWLEVSYHLRKICTVTRISPGIFESLLKPGTPHYIFLHILGYFHCWLSWILASQKYSYPLCMKKSWGWRAYFILWCLTETFPYLSMFSKHRITLWENNGDIFIPLLVNHDFKSYFLTYSVSTVS